MEAQRKSSTASSFAKTLHYHNCNFGLISTIKFELVLRNILTSSHHGSKHNTPLNLHRITLELSQSNVQRAQTLFCYPKTIHSPQRHHRMTMIRPSNNIADHIGNSQLNPNRSMLSIDSSSHLFPSRCHHTMPSVHATPDIFIDSR